LDVVKKGLKSIQEFLRTQQEENKQSARNNNDSTNQKNSTVNKKLNFNNELAIQEDENYDMVNEMNDVWASESEDETNAVPNKNRSGSSRIMQRSKSAASITSKRPFSSNSNYLKEYKNLITIFLVLVQFLFPLVQSCIVAVINCAKNVDYLSFQIQSYPAFYLNIILI